MRALSNPCKLAAAMVALLLTGFMLQVQASATIAIKFDVAALTSTADEVVLGRVMARQSKWEGNRIVTDVEIKVALPILGQSQEGQTLHVRSLGGRVGDLAQRVSGTANFAVGEEVFVFLEHKKNSNILRVVGLSQGRFHVIDGPNSQLQVNQNLSGLTLAKPHGKDDQGRTIAVMVPEGETGIPPMSLQTLIQEVGKTAKQLDLTVSPEVTHRFGADLKRSYDLRQDLRKLRPVTPAPTTPTVKPNTF